MTDSGSAAGAQLGAGRQAHIHEWGPGTVIKLYRTGFDGYEAEAAALSALDGRGIAPRLLEVVRCDGRTGLILERLHGADMLTVLRRQPWQVRHLAATMATAHMSIHSATAPPELPSLRKVLASRIDAATLAPPLKAFVVKTLGTLSDGDQLYHGDFHPGNLLISSDGPKVIDWPAAARGVPEADFARTMLLLRQATALPGTPLAFRVLMTAGRSLLANTYARTYRRQSSAPLSNVDAWILVQAAARLSEGITAEAPRLTAYVERAYRRTSRTWADMPCPGRRPGGLPGDG